MRRFSFPADIDFVPRQREVTVRPPDLATSHSWRHEQSGPRFARSYHGFPGRSILIPPESLTNFVEAKFVEVRGFEPLVRLMGMLRDS
jgi:hypothetical protein